MLNETKVALRGNVATEPALRITQNGTTVCSFRLAVTARRYSTTDSKVVDAETSWYTVTCWRSLAENVASSLKKGQGVLVQGRLRVRDFVHDNQPRTSADVTADVIGHDLTWGTSLFTANRRSRADETRDESDRTEADELATVVTVEDLDDVDGLVGSGLVDPGTGELVDELVGTDSLQASAARAAEPAF
jgi:single-strand DNA-binding protein